MDAAEQGPAQREGDQVVVELRLRVGPDGTLFRRGRAVPAARYEATLADIGGTPSYDYSSSAGVDTGALVLRSGDKAVFDVYAPRDDYFTVVPQATAPVRLALHGETVTAQPGKPLRLYLVAGNNRATLTARHAAVRSLDVSGNGSTTGTLSYETASATLAGGAALVDSPYASGGSAIGSLGNSPATPVAGHGGPRQPCHR